MSESTRITADSAGLLLSGYLGLLLFGVLGDRALVKSDARTASLMTETCMGAHLRRLGTDDGQAAQPLCWISGGCVCSRLAAKHPKRNSGPRAPLNLGVRIDT